MEKVPEYIAVSPITLDCPRCEAKPGEACDMLDGAVASIHLERIEVAITVDEAAKAKQKKPYSAFVDTSPLFVRLHCPQCGRDFTPKFRDVVNNNGDIACDHCHKPSNYRPNQLLNRV